MASAVLAIGNESNCPQARAGPGYMGKIPFLNPNSNNPNPNHPKSLSLSRKHQLSHHNGDEFSNPTASDDASSFNHHRKTAPAADFIPQQRGEGGLGCFHHVSFDISTYSRSELRSLKSRLMEELEQVRCLANRIESGQFQVVRTFSKKEKKLSGNKRSMPVPSSSGKESKRFASSSSPPAVLPPPQPPVNETVVASVELIKMCRLMLNKLMKMKFCWIFNQPVDVVGMKLYDYHQIIKHPMDLGTVKSKLSKNLYPSPDEFAADVRLTFNNALLYNPKGQDVHRYAEEYLSKFEQMFKPIYEKFEIEKQQQQKSLNWQPEKRNQQLHWQEEKRGQQCLPDESNRNMEKEDTKDVFAVEEVQGSSVSKMPSPPPARPKKTSSSKKLDRVESRPEPPPPPAEAAPVVRAASGRGPGGKLPKPKAKDLNKREMTMEEKHRLGMGLQSLPDEKMAQVVQIIRRRNGHLTEDGDEIELDIEAVDTETLWELDRFVTNYKKMASKIRRQALLPNNNNVAQNDSDMVGVSERMVDGSVGGAGKVKRGGEAGEEDVDIGDEMPMSHFPPVEIEKDDDGHAGSGSSSSSSSSSSDSSSSSGDSDSGSSSGSDSDVDDAQSRDNESKNFQMT